MSERKFVVDSPFSPAGDQPEAIEKLAEGVNRGVSNYRLDN